LFILEADQSDLGDGSVIRRYGAVRTDVYLARPFGNEDLLSPIVEDGITLARD
jgi:hypothetical protein